MTPAFSYEILINETLINKKLTLLSIRKTKMQFTIHLFDEKYIKRIFFRLSEIWNIFSRNMIKCHIFSRAGTASENMWHFIMLSENVYHISQKKREKNLFI
jgi:hypothetical protein